MKPVKTPDTNFTYKLPGGTSENDLPCERDMGANPFVRSTWNFDVDEADLFRTTEGALFIIVYGGDTEIRVHPRGERTSKLALHVLSRDETGTMYMVGAAGTQRDEILDEGTIDLVVFQVPPPPVALWVQSFHEVDSAVLIGGEPVVESSPDGEVVDGEVVAGRRRYMLVIDAPAEVEFSVLRPSIESALRGPSVDVLDMEVLPPIGDPENLDHPDTKGA